MTHLIDVDWWQLGLHFVSLSLLAIGGAITTAPDMHRYLVDERSWLTDLQFNASIAIAQAAPGPNVLFVALMGWHVGLNAGGGLQGGWHSIGLALLGASVTLFSMLIPSTTLTYAAERWSRRHKDHRAVRAFKTGMAPLVVALMVATGWVITAAHPDWRHDWPLWLLTLASTVIVWRTKTHLLVLLGAGAVLGALGWV